MQNLRGIFMTHVRSRNEKMTAQQWRLSWSQDGGRTFKALFEATDATNPPVLETDAADNLYRARPDYVNLNVYLYRFLSAEFNQPYAIGGCREITADGYIIGSFTELEGTEIKKVRGGKVWFFKIKAE